MPGMYMLGRSYIWFNGERLLLLSPAYKRIGSIPILPKVCIEDVPDF